MTYHQLKRVVTKMKAIEIKAPNFVPTFSGYKKVFLAGSIEMGKAYDWQSKMVDALSEEDIIFINPRRTDWDSSWEQKIENPQFNEQVNWEISGLEASDIIVMVFDPSTKSPITLLELGLFASSGKLVVFCPDGFWRKGNIDIVCHRFNITQVKSFEELIETIKS